MRKGRLSAGSGLGEKAVLVWVVLIILFFAFMTVILFPIMSVRKAPDVRSVDGKNGYVNLLDIPEASADEVFKLQGEWEFYPNHLYSFNDFTGGRTEASDLVAFPHNWASEPDTVMKSNGYATYRMRVRVPPSFAGIGIYSRFQYSAYAVYLNDVLICGAGVVSENTDEYNAVFLPTSGYTSSSVGAEGRTFSIIVQVQNETSSTGGLVGSVYIGSAEVVKNLRTILLTINGLVSGGLLVLFICLLLIYLSGRERREYLDYTIVSLVALFISLTNGGESLMYSTGIDSVMLVRLEYCAFITSAYFANYSVFKALIKPKAVFAGIYIYIVSAITFFILVPIRISSQVRAPIIAISILFFLLPLLNSAKNTILRHDFNSITSLISYLIVFAGITSLVSGVSPWDSVDIFSLSILLHCVLQLIMFLYRYRKTESSLKLMTETLEERIIERTSELTLMKEKAEAATEAKSNFLATMSHEIRTPMNAVVGISDLFRTDNLDETQKNYLHDIKKSSKALLQIINDILDFSKIEAGKFDIIPVHFNLLAMYDNICSLCRFAADAKKLDFRVSIEPGLPQYIYGDEIRFRQIVINIINNAIKYTKTGYVDFRVLKTERDGRSLLTFVVEDTGIGIKEEDFPKLFSAFEQLDSRSNRKIVGTGLGLSISKHLASLMDGDIQFVSEYGKGSTFTVFLPLVEGDKNKIIVQESFVSVMARGANVLVVDDNQINLTVAAGFLAVHGITPDTAASGAEAIEKIKSKPYDLVFMDHMMPEMDGVEATGVIRTIEGGRFADLPIIALTANAVTGIKDFFLAAGMDDYLSKPIDAMRINTLLAHWLPKEKVSFLASEQPEETESGDIWESLYQVDGLDVSAGLSHTSNNKTVYLSIIRQFCREFNGYIDGITAGIERCDWGNYAIRVHAMKGVFANLGMAELSARAYRLETAAKNKEYSVCQLETGALCMQMRRVYEQFVEALALEDSQQPVAKTAIDAQELAPMLEELKDACLLGDSDTSERLLSALGTRHFSDALDADLQRISDWINAFDFDLAADMIDKMLNNVAN